MLSIQLGILKDINANGVCFLKSKDIVAATFGLCTFKLETGSIVEH